MGTAQAAKGAAGGRVGGLLQGHGLWLPAGNYTCPRALPPHSTLLNPHPGAGYSEATLLSFSPVCSCSFFGLSSFLLSSVFLSLPILPLHTWLLLSLSLFQPHRP
jgi:hypothetical protein